jgi:hypothetical protein
MIALRRAVPVWVPAYKKVRSCMGCSFDLQSYHKWPSLIRRHAEIKEKTAMEQDGIHDGKEDRLF